MIVKEKYKDDYFNRNILPIIICLYSAGIGILLGAGIAMQFVFLKASSSEFTPQYLYAAILFDVCVFGLYFYIGYLLEKIADKWIRTFGGQNDKKINVEY